jgi:hypothetical protein
LPHKQLLEITPFLQTHTATFDVVASYAHNSAANYGAETGLASTTNRIFLLITINSHLFVGNCTVAQTPWYWQSTKSLPTHAAHPAFKIAA